MYTHIFISLIGNVTSNTEELILKLIYVKMFQDLLSRIEIPWIPVPTQRA